MDFSPRAQDVLNIKSWSGRSPHMFLPDSRDRICGPRRNGSRFSSMIFFFLHFSLFLFRYLFKYIPRGCAGTLIRALSICPSLFMLYVFVHVFLHLNVFRGGISRATERQRHQWGVNVSGQTDLLYLNVYGCTVYSISSFSSYVWLKTLFLQRLKTHLYPVDFLQRLKRKLMLQLHYIKWFQYLCRS